MVRIVTSLPACVAGVNREGAGEWKENKGTGEKGGFLLPPAQTHACYAGHDFLKDLTLSNAL